MRGGRSAVEEVLWDFFDKLSKRPVFTGRLLRMSKKLRESSDNRATGELEGVKTRLEYNNPPSEKA